MFFVLNFFSLYKAKILIEIFIIKNLHDLLTKYSFLIKKLFLALVFVHFSREQTRLVLIQIPFQSNKKLINLR